MKSLLLLQDNIKGLFMEVGPLLLEPARPSTSVIKQFKFSFSVHESSWGGRGGLDESKKNLSR